MPATSNASLFQLMRCMIFFLVLRVQINIDSSSCFMPSYDAAGISCSDIFTIWSKLTHSISLA